MYSNRLLVPVLRRRYASTSTPGSPQSNSYNTLLFITGVAAAAGAYYYLRERSVDDVPVHEEIMAQKARESLEAGKVRAADAWKQAEQKLDQVKKTASEDMAAGKARLKSAEESGAQTLRDAESRMRELGSEAKTRKESKGSWLSWLGWGKD